MTCRESRLASAMQTIARSQSGLSDNQVLGLYHQLLREGHEHACPSETNWHAFIDMVDRRYQAGELTVRSGSRDIRRRLRIARESEAPSGPRAYANARIIERATRVAGAQRAYLTGLARDLGISEDDAAEQFRTAYADASADTSAQASPAFARAFTANPDHADLLVDRRSLYAYEQVEIARAARLRATEHRPAVTRERVESTAIAEVGYDQLNGRLEIVMNSNPDRVYAYRMNSMDYLAFRSSPSMGAYFARHIRGNDQFAYGSAEEAAEAAVHRRCPSCGQWAGTYHACPTHGSTEELNRDVREAVRAARARAAGTTVADAPRTARMQSTRTTRYLDNSLSLRMPGATRITAEARRASIVEVPVHATYAEADGGMVTGHVAVEYLGRGRGYDVTAVTEPGDSRTDHLKCTCARYRANGHCEHVDGVVERVNAVVNNRDAATPEQVAPALEETTAAVTAQHDAAAAAVAIRNGEWQPLGANLAENPAIFQSLYTEARAARAAYQDAIANGENADLPIPYYTENAFGGIAQRGSGRGFGTEIEFSFPPGTTQDERNAALAEIGRELKDAGLIVDARQKGYGASHGWFRDQHANGWAFEEDPSTGAWPGYSGNDTHPVNGGEIISPVMYDEPETWANLAKVCDIIKRHGGIASKRAGLHVHVGTGDYDHDVANHNRLLASFMTHEDVMYRLSANPATGRHRGQGYCSPNEEPSSPYTTVADVTDYNDGHDIALNMQSVDGGRGDHVEFRTFDSSLHPGAIQAQIASAVFMAEGATRPGGPLIVGGNAERLGHRLEVNPDRSALTGEAWHASTKNFRTFLDRHVPGDGGDPANNKHLKQLVSLFAMTKWQRNRSAAAFW